MAAVLPPNPVPLRRRAVRDGTLLLANQAANLVNVPATGNAAHDFRAFIATLKAPRVNDENAQEQVVDIEGYEQRVEAISAAMDQLEVNHNGTAADFVTLLEEFDEYLASTGEELQNLQRQSLAVKFASQNEIARFLDAKKEETLNRIIVFCFENGLLANYTTAQTRADLKQFMKLVNRRFEDERLSRAEIKRLVARETYTTPN
ncbi:hypothetical protein FRC07_000506 [Ceratobasidium sp. 392]|nr:hypothetical protein FRC07_000506 [Ceratobasidium sp. 392]